MADSNLQQYIRDARMTTDIPHPEVTKPRLALKSRIGDFGSRDFSMTWWPITEPFEMIGEPHAHDFDQYVIFVGGDITNMMDLGGEVEFSLGRDPEHMEKFVFTEARMVYIPAGLYHSPLNFKRVNDPSKPILFHDLYFAPEYARLPKK
jgi:hypothetical protein